MSTRSNIIIKIHPEDYEMVTKKIHSKVDEITPYINVYCHFDGYFSHMGVELLKHFNDYSKALELILGGSMSYIENGIPNYYADTEGYELNKPKTKFRPTEIEYHYNYVYEDKWYYLSHNNLWDLNNVLESKGIKF